MTELVFILDRSGSMSGLEKDTIGGFNSMIEKQKKEAGEALVSTVLFDNESVVIHDRLPLDAVPCMTEKEYFTRGCTALLDAVGSAIHHIGTIHKYARKEDVPENTMFIITTDGYENASNLYDGKDIQKLIARKKNDGWKFVFLAAGIDAEEQADALGLDRRFAVRCNHNRNGIRSMSKKMADGVRYCVMCDVADYQDDEAFVDLLHAEDDGSEAD